MIMYGWMAAYGTLYCMCGLWGHIIVFRGCQWLTGNIMNEHWIMIMVHSTHHINLWQITSLSVCGHFSDGTHGHSIDPAHPSYTLPILGWHLASQHLFGCAIMNCLSCVIIVIYHCSLTSPLLSVDCPPAHRLDHRNFISYLHMHIDPHAHKIFNQYIFKW